MTTCLCCGSEIVRSQYFAESEEDFQKRLNRQTCRSKCRRLAAPVKTERVKPTLEVSGWNHERPEMVAQEKELPVRDLARLAFARSMPCCVCGAIEGVQAHHEQEEGHGTMAGKTSDRRTAPLCWRCHSLRHEKGRSFYGAVDIDDIITQINIAYDQRSMVGNGAEV
jgi:hypothetical protein